MAQPLSLLIQLIFALVVLAFAVYLALELRVLRISRRVERRRLDEITLLPLTPSVEFHPPVSVLLPVRDETAMVARLIDAACRLQYPPEALEILVLDDSTDATAKLAAERVAHHAAAGVNIRHIRRPDRKGYKAGNLRNGLRYVNGQFLAIFDADFVPPADFLLQTLPFFRDETLGYLQTGIGYENHDHSFLTRFQAMEMGHQQYVTIGLSADGSMASLSGSSCVWRRACVEALGGWTAETVTEDVDLGYRAQLDAWKYAYLPEVVSMSVLPQTAAAFRLQRERWGRGLIHGGFRHVRRVFAQRMPWLRRMHALAMMFSALLLASIYVVVLFSLPLSSMARLDGMGVHTLAWLFFALVAVWALSNTRAAARSTRTVAQPGLLRFLWETYLYVALFLPMAWYYFAGGIRALLGVHGGFHRTPKGDNEHRAALPPINRLLWAGEVFTFLYCAVALVLALQAGHWFVVPLNVTACVGFGMILYWSRRDGRARRREAAHG